VSGALYLVGIPIGNLDDLSARARETLASVSLVAAEDTRRTGRLLKGLGVSVPLVSLFDANEAARVPAVLDALASGDVAVVSDGGMPLVSDPGYRLVQAALDAGIDVRVVPGPSAVTAALVVSGLPSDRWVFEGFLPKKAGERARRLAAVGDDPRTLVLFESPKRVAFTLAAIAEVLGGDRPVAVCRELTKLHETVRRGPAAELANELAGVQLKGEVVIVVGGAEPATGDLDAAVDDARAEVVTGVKPREASRRAAARHGVRANAVYEVLARGGPDAERS